MEDHPDFPRVLAELENHGFTVRQTTDAPFVRTRAVYDVSGRDLLRMEQEIHLREGMRFLDLEHELGHVHQLTDRGRFPEGPPPMEAVRERPNGTFGNYNNAPGVLSARNITVAEYHVRLQEFIRLAERSVDAEVLATHGRGVDTWRHNYQDAGRRDRSISGFVQDHFPDIRDLERQVEGLRAGSGTEPHGRQAPRFPHDGGGLQKSDGPPPPDGPPPGGPTRAYGPPPPDGPPVRDGEGLHGAGAERGLDPSPSSIEQGTVRMEDHPDFPRVMQELQDLGFTVRHTDGDPYVQVTRVVGPDGQVIRVDQDINLRPGMRFLDLEHEMGHVHQVTDTARFPDGVPANREFTEHPDGRQRVNRDAPGLLRGWRIEVAEYHVRLQEFIRLAERGVDGDVLRAHWEGVRDHAAEFDRTVGRRPEMNERPRWANQHFPDIPELRARANELADTMRQGAGDPHTPPPPRTGPPDGDGPSALPKSADDPGRADIQPPRDGPPPRDDTPTPPAGGTATQLSASAHRGVDDSHSSGRRPTRGPIRPATTRPAGSCSGSSTRRTPGRGCASSTGSRRSARPPDDGPGRLAGRPAARAVRDPAHDKSPTSAATSCRSSTDRDYDVGFQQRSTVDRDVPEPWTRRRCAPPGADHQSAIEHEWRKRLTSPHPRSRRTLEAHRPSNERSTWDDASSQESTGQDRSPTWGRLSRLGDTARLPEGPEDIAEAWIRLREGRHIDPDLVLLEHELAESTICGPTRVRRTVRPTIMRTRVRTGRRLRRAVPVRTSTSLGKGAGRWRFWWTSRRSGRTHRRSSTSSASRRWIAGW